MALGRALSFIYLKSWTQKPALPGARRWEGNLCARSPLVFYSRGCQTVLSGHTPCSFQISPWTSLGWWMPRVSSDMVEKGREAHHTTPPFCLALFFCFPVFVLQGSAQLPPLPGSPQGALPPLHWYLRSCVNLISLKSHLLSYILHSKGPSSCSSCRQHHCCHSSAPTPCSALPVDYLIS